MNPPKSISCPICGRETKLAAAPLGLFCSDRCKLVDLGKWLGEEYRVSEPLRPDHLAEFEGMDGADPDRSEAP